MPSRSPFADVTDGPAEDAVVVALGRPTRAALGCFGLTTLFLAAVALAALSYAVFDEPGPTDAPAALRVVAAVLGALFLLMVVGLATIAVRALRHRQGVAFDADAVWWRGERAVVRLPWAEIAVVRVVAPVIVKGMRTSAPRTPSVEVCPLVESTVLGHPELADQVTSGEPVRPDLPGLRFTFRLSSADDEPVVADAVARFAADRWTADRPG
jgi:hypothetical protein